MEWIFVILCLTADVFVVGICICSMNIRDYSSEITYIDHIYKLIKSDQENIRTLKSHIEKLQYEIAELKSQMNI